MPRSTFTKRTLVALASLAVALPALSQIGGTEAIGFWTISGGGGSSSGGTEVLRGSAGLHSVATSTGVGLSVRGGFWPGAGVTATAVDDDTPGVAATRLLTPYPNPFNPATRIRFELTAQGGVRVRIYGARGQLVRELVDEAYPAGRHEVLWNGRDTRGGEAPSGVYFVRFEALGREATTKITLLK